jgi:hypothetical protein
VQHIRGKQTVLLFLKAQDCGKSAIFLRLHNDLRQDIRVGFGRDTPLARERVLANSHYLVMLLSCLFAGRNFAH